MTRVICGSLAADDLVTMDPKEMASSETKKWREQVAEYKKMELMDNMSYQRYAFKGRELPDGKRSRADACTRARARVRGATRTRACARLTHLQPARLGCLLVGSRRPLHLPKVQVEKDAVLGEADSLGR